MLTPAIVDKQSPFLGEECALCKDPLAPGDTVIICPEDGSRHHDRCWSANGHQCAAYGCPGQGQIATASTAAPPAPIPSPPHPLFTPSSYPPLTRSQSCANTCLILAIAISIIFFAIGCFGLWAIADYLMLNVWDLPYRAPFSGTILPFFGTL